MSIIQNEIILDKIPEAVRAEAEAAGITDADCLFSMRSDLDFDGRTRDVWMVLTKTQVYVLAPGEAPKGLVNGPIDWKKAQKVRAFSAVGSAFLQLLIDGVYVDVVRFSNARREMFDRARIELEHLLEGQEVSGEALLRPSQRVCNVCGLPLPGRGASCARCNARKGLFTRTLALMAPYRGSVLLLLGMMVAGVVLDLIPPYLTKVLIDNVLAPIQPEHMHWLTWILLALLVASALRQFLAIFIGRMSSLIGTRITKDLRERMVTKLLDISVDYYDRYSSGSLMSRVLYDTDYFQGFVVQVSQGFLLNIMRVLGIGAVLFFMDWRLALLVLLPVPIVVIGTVSFWKHIYPQYYRLWDSQSKSSQLLAGLFSGIRLVKAFGQEKREEKRFGDAAGYMQSARRSVEMSQATFNPIMGFVFGLGGLIIWYAGGHDVLNGMKLGTLMAFIGYVSMFYQPITALSMFSNWLTGFLTAGQRVFELLDASSAVTEETKPVRVPRVSGGIEFRNVTFGYDPYNPVLKNVSLKIEPGQSIGIVGKSGSGKTTLVNLLCRFYDVQQGQVLIDGVDVAKMSLEDLHRQVALVLQEPFLFRASIAENVAYGRPDSPPLVIMDAAKAANAHLFISRLPGGYDTQLGERGAGLSGGERQRVSIARALLSDPRILILDEATSSVDTESEQEIQRALAVMCKGRTTIAIAHRLSTLKNADCIYVIDEGRIAESGTHEQLMAVDGIYHNLVRIQTELTRLEV